MSKHWIEKCVQKPFSVFLFFPLWFRVERKNWGYYVNWIRMESATTDLSGTWFNRETALFNFFLCEIYFTRCVLPWIDYDRPPTTMTVLIVQYIHGCYLWKSCLTTSFGPLISKLPPHSTVISIALTKKWVRLLPQNPTYLQHVCLI